MGASSDDSSPTKIIMIKKFFSDILVFFLATLLRTIIWLRYRVTVKGLNSLDKEELLKRGGVLFLPNHPTVLIDPVLVSWSIWRKFPLRPLIVEYMFYSPIVNFIAKATRGLPVPNFNVTSNSLKRKKSEEAINAVIEGMKHGDNFLIYPSGKVKESGYEHVGGSAIHQILQEVPHINVVLVRTTGLWGSKFSKAFLGKSPPMFKTLWWGAKQTFKNLLFLNPRRNVTIEFALAPPDFPIHGTRLEINKYLEKWYNLPFENIPNHSPELGEPLTLVPYSIWSKELPKIERAISGYEKEVDLSKIPLQMQEKIKRKIALLAGTEPEKITPQMHLSSDLGLDSLDVSELVVYIQKTFNTGAIPVVEMTTVQRLLGYASKQIESEEESEKSTVSTKKWQKKEKKCPIELPEGDTIIETFLNNCQRFGPRIFCADDIAGILTFSQAKFRVILLAQYIQTLPGEYVGIMLPASVAASLCILACQLCGKIPLMINWTVGPRHLESVIESSKVQTILSSWAFIDRLENVEFNGIEDRFILLEDVRNKLTLSDKIKSFWIAKKNTKSILKTFSEKNRNKNELAVLLFTSGTEAMPKGVPLTHENILCNLRATNDTLNIFSNDIFFSVLPPFHSFGFSIGTIFAMISGIRVVFFPDPTNGMKMAEGIEKWEATVMCGAPSFLKVLFNAATKEQLKTLRMCVSGAEKAPQELFALQNEKVPQACLIEGYGITECSPVISANIPGESLRGVGKPLSNLEICIVGVENHLPLPKGEQGLILVRGPSVFSGYLNKQNSPFLQLNGKEWYITGDLGLLDDQGYLHISGRLKRFIKIGGEMISLTSIETALLEMAIKKGWTIGQDGAAFAICAKENPGDKPQIKVFMCYPLDLEEINSSLREAGLSNLVRITDLKVLPEIPLMGTGKVNYRLLESEYMKTP